MDARQEIIYRAFQKYARFLYDVLMDTSIMNPQFVPEDGPCVVVSNHRSDVDPFLLMVNIKRPINWMGASYLWNIPFAKDFIAGLGAIPVSKYQSEIRKAFERAAKLLTEGQAVGIFPEGWDYIAANQFDWSVGKFQTGFARIAIQTGSPVVPVALLGLDEIRMPQPFPPAIRKFFDYPIEMQYIKDRCVYRKLHINVGRPIPCPKGADPNDREAVKAFTEQVNEVVVELYNEIPNIVGFENVRPKPAGPRKEEGYKPDLTEEELDDAQLQDS
jgi:1-acyl-sn-glycerol-3-phosphate acyltransferase